MHANCALWKATGMHKRIKNHLKRIMFHLHGIEFSNLVRREFTETAAMARNSGKQDGLFECYITNRRSAHFDILHLRSGFETDLQVNDFQDNSHVSLHFQLSGYSEASISGLRSGLAMKGGRFNLFNCVDPVSTFLFPRQEGYEYLCVGLKPDFFNQILQQCGKDYDGLLSKSIGRKPFSLFEVSRATDHWQWNTLQLLQNPPVADSLKSAYIKAKVEELTLLSLGVFGKDNVAGKLGRHEESRLYQLKEYLDLYYLTAFSLEELGKRFLLNEFKLKGGFRKLFGTTVFGYVQQKRMEYARQLLEAGGTSVQEVATITGYESDASFIRAFKAFYGVSPGKLKGAG
jgi:AraC family transcriptional activator of pyochelin receptor